MKKTLSTSLVGSAMALALLTSCNTNNEEKLESKITEVLNKNPEIIFQAIEKNPEQFVKVVQNAAKSAQQKMAEKRQAEEVQQIEQSIDSPLAPEITASHLFKGAMDAPITIVEYSDFQCPFCKKGMETITNLMNKYPGKVKFVFKHLPLSFHSQAMISAQYFEAIALQSRDKAFLFHDKVFQNQGKLKQGEGYLLTLAKDMNLDIDKLKKDIKSSQVKEKILKDMQEAKKFGMEGTPGFIINGVPVRGAYPAEYFVSILDKLQERGKLEI